MARLILGGIAVAIMAVGLLCGTIRAYAASDTQEVITAAAVAHGVSPSWMLRTAWCESRYDRYAHNGQYLGLFQMGARMRADFSAWATRQGVTPDVYDPSQVSNYVAELFVAGRAGNWTCA